ncbi:putative YccA/Bax inhibitor family protein [Roseimicrobium gellanilyticum]|uniref:Putative YccA/Bax inhibitor family protein n=1 Tax=Roseimicrobium gellanilyticum TaxID=748857 RepID=A0A366H0Q0_9BACT|nr:Bax inhibitor-1/YccA family protein [Roseimicrobium gellanilyticum]RBP35311.1 putative YccA/Bax inhibitor family protein [Roseimicrobium gellanilyticum]
MRTSNPTLSDSTFSKVAAGVTNPMTLQGTVNKTALLLMILLVPAAYTWNATMANPAASGMYIAVGAIVGLILAVITSFKMEWSPITAPLYAAAEGVFLGAISARYNMVYEGIVLQAVMLTCGTLLGLLAAYSMRLIKATENFKLGIVAATGGIMLVYLATMVLRMFNIDIPYIHGSGTVGIGFSVVVVIIAALNLVMDFDFIENGCAQGAPKYMEWYASFGLLVTLVWLYLEMLRLLAKLADRK